MHATPMVERPEHRRVLTLLSWLNAPLLCEARCWLAGGTAVALRCGEYRVSHHVDFLCATRDGYHMLREVVFNQGLRGLFTRDMKILPGLRMDRYGIRAAVDVGGVAVKLELELEARIAIAGISAPGLPVARLTDEDLVAEKLLANADRFLDDDALGRDALDLMMLQHHLGKLPEGARAKARGAYGQFVDRALERALGRLSGRRDLLSVALDALDVRLPARQVIVAHLATLPLAPP